MSPPFPARSCDTHLHVYDARYPTSAGSVLRPPDASVDAYRELQRELGLERAVVVQPTTYGLDNRCQLAAVAALGSAARAVVVIDEHTTTADIEDLDRGGARAARFHMLPGGAVGWDALRPVADRIAEFGWHIQLQMDGRQFHHHLDVLSTLPTDLVVDHVGRFMPPVAPSDPRFDALLGLLDSGRCWVKLSAPYESAADPTHRYHAVGALVSHLVRRFPERLLWASNWPHPGQDDPPAPEDLVRLTEAWLPDHDTRRRVLVDNPARLYGFDTPSPTEEMP